MARTQARSSTRPHLATDPERERRIRERAYFLWEADGGPHGRDVEYWERACELTSVEETTGSGVIPNSRTAPGRPRQGAVTKTTIKANPGKIPDGPDGQNDIKTIPPPRRAAGSKPKKPA